MSTEKYSKELTENMTSDKKVEEDNNTDEKQKEKHYWLSFSVIDTGQGIPEETRRKCFTLFGNTKVKNDINQGGMGLGLAATNMICKALQGQINLVRTETDVGSKFNMVLPVKLGTPITSESIKSESDRHP